MPALGAPRAQRKPVVHRTTWFPLPGQAISGALEGSTSATRRRCSPVPRPGRSIYLSSQRGKVQGISLPFSTSLEPCGKSERNLEGFMPGWCRVFLPQRLLRRKPRNPRGRSGAQEWSRTSSWQSVCLLPRASQRLDLVCAYGQPRASHLFPTRELARAPSSPEIPPGSFRVAVEF